MALRKENRITIQIRRERERRFSAFSNRKIFHLVTPKDSKCGVSVAASYTTEDPERATCTMCLKIILFPELYA